MFATLIVTSVGVSLLTIAVQEGVDSFIDQRRTAQTPMLPQVHGKRLGSVPVTTADAVNDPMLQKVA